MVIVEMVMYVRGCERIISKKLNAVLSRGVECEWM